MRQPGLPHILSDAQKERFLRLLEPVHDNLVRFACSLTESREAGRDLVGETVLQALEKFEDLQDENAFLSWLFTIAVRLNRRRKKRSELFGHYDEHAIAHRSSGEVSPETGYDVDALYRAIGRLRPKEQEAILLFEIAGLSLQEIKEVQGGSLSGVKSRLARGRKKLARLLGETADQYPKKKTVHQHQNNESTGNYESETFIYAGIGRHE